MEVLSKDLEAFLNQLVELAGDSSIVQQAIAEVNSRAGTPTLAALVHEILVLKKRKVEVVRDHVHA